MGRFLSDEAFSLLPGRRIWTASGVRVAQTCPARANYRSVKSAPSRRRVSKVDFRRIGAKRCRTGRLALDGPFRVGNARPQCEHTETTRPERGTSFRRVLEGVGERGGRFDGVGDINLRGPSVSTNSSSGIHDYRSLAISGGDDQSSLMMTNQ